MRWVSPFGNLRINAHLQLPEAYRSLSRLSSAPDAKAFPLYSLQLDLVAADSVSLASAFGESSLSPSQLLSLGNLWISSRFWCLPERATSIHSSKVTLRFGHLWFSKEKLELCRLPFGFNCSNRYPSTIRSSTIKVFNLSVACSNTIKSNLSLVQFSRCRSLTSFEIRFECSTPVEHSNLTLIGGPEWARTTDLPLIRRTL